ncbi:MAG TPA: radical SAM protein [Candidatus Korarchaeota archaeon]|nr:radical SAM protein [Candidatus Korarchaeota archaeon]
MVSIVYGPVPSWRLGRSLGVDVTLPPKACTFNCVYCQLGKTVRRLSSPKEFNSTIRVEELIRQLEHKMESIGLASIDFITFSGTGEPTLNPDLGNMISAVKRFVPSKPVAVLTNSSLLYLDEVRSVLSNADLVSFKLDAADQWTFEEINRPVENVPNIGEIIDSIMKFKVGYQGVLALQIMLVDSFRPNFRVNFSEEALSYLIESVAEIQPDQIQLNTPTRPVMEKHIKPVNSTTLSIVEERIRKASPNSDIIRVDKEKIVLKSISREKRPLEELREEILALLRRRPCRAVDISISLGVEQREIEAILKSMVNEGVISEARGERGIYYIFSG